MANRIWFVRCECGKSVELIDMMEGNCPDCGSIVKYQESVETKSRQPRKRKDDFPEAVPFTDKSLK